MKITVRILACLICLACLLGVLPFAVSATEITIKADGINTFRGSGMLVIYTSDYGEKTATNEWGSEAVVGADHKVTAVGGNNSNIPKGGFVVSGHDSDDGKKMKTWVNTNFKVGDYVYYNDRTLEITISDVPLDPNANVFYTLTQSITGVNLVRYTDNMIIYTTAKGTSTGTNAYGYEVSVKDGIVTAMGGNNTPLSTKGMFVVSGHGTSAEWLRNNVTIGMGCSYDAAKKTVTFSYDANSLEKGLQVVLEQTEKKISDAKKLLRYLDYKTLESDIADAKKMLSDAFKQYKKDKNDGALAQACNAVQAKLDSCTVTESYTVQYRGAWLRPSQKSAAEVDAFVEQLSKLGINTLCVEGSFDSTVIFKVPEGCLYTHNPAFNYDVLQAYIDACHKRGMECHLWMSICNVASFNNKNYALSPAKKKPEWLVKDETGSVDSENHFCMIDLANEEARNYLLSFYEYILKNYDIDCFELDYIRYIDRGAHDYGYTDAAIKGFQKEYNTTAVPTFDTNASYWNDWVQFRKDSISKLVKGVRDLIDRINPDVLLSADVVPDPATAGVNNYQDYLRWEKEGWLDLLKPMAYGAGFDDAITQQVKNGGDKCAVAVGLGVFMDELGAADMVKQASRDNELATMGDIYFEASAYIRDKAGEALLQSAYKNSAIPPFFDKNASLVACLAYMDGHIKDVLLPLDGLTKAEAEAILKASEAAAKSVKDGKIGANELHTLREAIKAVKNNLANRQLKADLYRAEQITCIAYKVTVDELENEIEKPEPTEESGDDTSGDTSSETSTGESSESGESSEESDTESGAESGESKEESGKEASEGEEESKNASAPASESEAETSSDEEEGKFPWMWIGFGAFAVFAVCSAVVIILKRRKK